MKSVGIQISPEDNVVTLVDDVPPGATVQYMTAQGRQEVTTSNAIPFGHKIAVRDIRDGETVLKYNETIGRASQAISRGEHVHVHNVESAVQGGGR